VANPESEALGTIVESHLDPREGVLATILIQNGTLCCNDYLVFDNILFGRIKAMKDWNGAVIKKASPGMPVRVLGFKIVPSVGDIIRGRKEARGLEKAKPELFRQAPPVLPETKEGKKEKQFLNIILKADVQGSLEAIASSLEKLEHPEVGIKIIAKDVGQVGEAEVLQAEATKATIYCFNIETSEPAEKLASAKNITVKSYRIIYELLDDVKHKLELILAPEVVRTSLGKIKIIKIFRTEKSYVIAGGLVEDGKVLQGAKVSISRSGQMLGEGEISELQSAKQAVKEMRMGSECGLKISTRIPLQVGDILDVFVEEEKERKLGF
jgi:translation initiation factor IF-2